MILINKLLSCRMAFNRIHFHLTTIHHLGVDGEDLAQSGKHIVSNNTAVEHVAILFAQKRRMSECTALRFVGELKCTSEDKHIKSLYRIYFASSYSDCPSCLWPHK